MGVPRVWRRYRPINYPKLIEMTGGFAAPLLAGFSLTTVTQLVIGTDHPWLSEWSIALFAIAAALLIYALQFSATALGYAATPSERLDYFPEAAFNPKVLHRIRKRQWEEMGLRHKYNVRMKYCYNFGLLAFLGGLGLILVPHQSWPWPWGRFVGVVVVGVSIVIELAWTLSGGSRPRLLLPTELTVKPDKIEDDGAEYLFDHRAMDEAAVNLLKCVELLEKMVSAKITELRGWAGAGRRAVSCQARTS